VKNKDLTDAIHYTPAPRRRKSRFGGIPAFFCKPLAKPMRVHHLRRHSLHQNTWRSVGGGC
jgi:hypothetical protein